ncbi:MAG: PilC/PilY family type IV pilus protein [Thiobacillus sp.]
MNLNQATRKSFALLLMFSSLVWMTVPAHSAPLTISENPLFLTTNVAPNVITTLDDSGSMSRAFTPDLCGNPNAICDNNPDPSLDPRYVKSSHFNPIYYNPATTYTAPKDASGTALTTSFNNAWIDGYVHSLSLNSASYYNLATQYRPTAGLFLSSGTKSHEFMRHYASDVRCQASACQYNSTVGTGTNTWVNMGGSSCSSNATCQTRQMPAYYYVFDGTNSNCTGTDAQKAVDNDCYDIKIVGASEQQNFATWYSFYRTRNLAAIGSASLAFAAFDASTRVAWQSLNTCRSSTTVLPYSGCQGWDAATGVSNAVKPFAGTHKQDFYAWLFHLPTSSSTPLREAMKRVGVYYSTTGENSPYDDDLNTAGTVTATAGQTSCRKDFHILMTDGIWNDSTPSGIGNTDGSLSAPYKDSNSDSLADVAYKYWSTDLAPSLSNNLIPYIVESGAEPGQTNNPKNDPATWQHMVNFTIGIGLTPFLTSTGLTYGDTDPNTPDTYTGSYPLLAAGTKAWPTTGANLDGNVADLWHAAINSRGQFFSADTPADLVGSFKKVKDAIEVATPSAAALAANSTSIQTGALVYQATFDSKDWRGDLKAFSVGIGGVVGTVPEWSAAAKLPAAASRTIFTINGGSGVGFNWGALSSGQQAYLNTSPTGTADTKGSDRLDWLTGVQTKEIKNGGTFRNRAIVLGDIINSDPAFAQADDFGYATLGASEAASYAAYVTAKAGRTPAVFVGGNDGMLHAFRADAKDAQSGVELFAYVPNAVFPNLSKLTDPAYNHKYYVDGGPTVGDAYLSGGWTTVLVGGLGGGGNSIYALNVSNVASPSASMVMWEFTDPDLGLTYSKPQIGRLNNGQWVAIFGNGYNSASGKAYLYVVNLENGALIKKIAAGSATSNGLSTPALYDANNDQITDFAYAGDLQGNLWKFDLTSFADQTAPLFVASNASSQVQPITAQPVVGAHPNGGAMVYFGTGQYLQSTDVLNTQVQSFYGFWDKDSALAVTATVNRSALQAQSIVAQTSQTFTIDDKGTVTTADDITQTSALRETSGNAVDWTVKRGWYLDFTEPSSTGERVVTQALLHYGRVVFLTVVPSTNVCQAGGDSWLMELDAVTGAKVGGSSFDFNNDGAFDSKDYLASGSTVSGVKTTVGITKPPAWFTGSDGKDYKVMTGTTGAIQSLGNKGAPPTTPGVPGSLRRVYWLQIQ